MTEAIRSLSLFSGCCGLDLGLERAGIHSACLVEIDPDCAKVFKHRINGPTVVKDVRKVSAELGSFEVVAGGFPCQDLSYAGRGAGLDGDKSGLWFEMIRVVRELEPRLVIVENVPGLLTRGIVVVLHDLARAGYAGRWFSVAAADVGAPHRRERVFIIAKRVTQRGVELAGPNPAGLFDEDGWVSPQESLFDRDFLARLGKRGRWSLDGVYEEDKRLALEDESDEMLLPTPNAMESTPTAEYVQEVKDAGVQPDARLYLPGRKWHSQRTLSRVAPALLPTPMADEREKSTRPRGVLPREVQKLLPTPQGSDSDRGPDYARERERRETHGSGGDDLVTAVAKLKQETDELLPTPQARDFHGPQGNAYLGGASDLPAAVARLTGADNYTLLPTPTTQDGANNGGPSQMDRNSLPLNAEVKLLPTPTVADAEGGRTSKGAERPDEHGLAVTAKLLPTPSATHNDGHDPDKFLERREAEKAKGQNGNGFGLTLGMAAALLPTPVANPDNPGAGGELRAALEHGPGRRNETGVDSMGRPNTGRPSKKLLPTPRAEERMQMNSDDDYKALSKEVTLLPTPTSQASKHGSTPDQFAGGFGYNLWDVPHLMEPTEQSPWGVYGAAVARWEQVCGRPAPPPTDEKARLSPAFVEWMLGFPEGWTDVPGVARTARLRMLGNSVQVQVGTVVGAMLLALDRELE